MIPVLLIAGLAFAVGVAVVTFWDEIKKYLGLAYQHVKKMLHAAIVGVVAYVKKGSIAGAVIAAYKFYSKDDKGRWQETVTTKTISESEVPEHIRRKLEECEQLDISEELQLELKG